MAVSKRTRYEVLKRDNHTCRYCGQSAPDVKLTVDHVTPVALGGTDKPDNLVAACRDCNAGKASTSPDAAVVEDVKQDALRWAKAMEVATARRAAERTEMTRYGFEFYQDWTEHTDGIGRKYPLPDGFADSVERFYTLGLPFAELRRAVAISMTRDRVGAFDKFAYACGICWSVLREIQDEAARVVAEGGE